MCVLIGMKMFPRSQDDKGSDANHPKEVHSLMDLLSTQHVRAGMVPSM